jgi:hypothetical protein
MRFVLAGCFSVLGLAAFAAQGCEPSSAKLECSFGDEAVCTCPNGQRGVRVCDGAAFGPCIRCGSASATGSGGAVASSGSGAGTSAGGSGGSGGTPPFDLSDPLTDGQPQGNVVGGSLGPTGWTVTAKTDRIWYALPRLVEGSIEFTVAGVTLANLDLADHEIFSLYDAGHGIPEPINYNPEFRDNHYKQLIRIYGQQVPERLGLQKFIMLMCPDGAPGYGACQCPMSFYDGDGWWGGDGNWDGSPSVIKVTWGNGQSTYSRNGVDVWTNNYSTSGLAFGPAELHFTIGCPRHDAVGDAGMPIGATFSNVVVHGIEGPVETCN